MTKRPTRAGVNKSGELKFEVKQTIELMSFLLLNMPNKNRDNIKTILRDCQALVDGQPVSQYNYYLQPGQVVTVTRNKIRKAKTLRGISIIYEDNDLIVIDKHAGILSVATGSKYSVTAYSLLREHSKVHNESEKVFIVHRLDRDTSGLMVFAKSPVVQRKLQESWHEAVTERTYIAIAEGIVEPSEGEIASYLKEDRNMMVHSSDKPNEGQWSVTHYTTLRKNDWFSMLKVNLRTGRKNQIRVHLRDIGHPITGDKKYGARFNPMGRMGLHALTLAFVHPVTRREMRFETPIPRKFTDLFKHGQIQD